MYSHFQDTQLRARGSYEDNLENFAARYGPDAPYVQLISAACLSSCSFTISRRRGQRYALCRPEKPYKNANVNPNTIPSFLSPEYGASCTKAEENVCSIDWKDGNSKRREPARNRRIKDTETKKFSRGCRYANIQVNTKLVTLKHSGLLLVTCDVRGCSKTRYPTRRVRIYNIRTACRH